MPPANPSKKAEPLATRDRLLEAALKIFSRDGLHRATTRVIAEEAGVNEVTLFRHFQSKEGLLGAVMSEVVTAHANADLENESQWTGDLKKNMTRFAESFYAMMERDEAFIRTMIGEARRHPDHAQAVIKEAVKPVRDRFISNLENARKAGLVREGIDLGISADVFTAMMLGGMLKNSTHCMENYTSSEFVTTCVDIFCAGLAPVPSSKSFI